MASANVGPVLDFVAAEAGAGRFVAALGDRVFFWTGALGFGAGVGFFNGVVLIAGFLAAGVATGVLDRLAGASVCNSHRSRCAALRTALAARSCSFARLSRSAILARSFFYSEVLIVRSLGAVCLARASSLATALMTLRNMGKDPVIWF